MFQQSKDLTHLDIPARALVHLEQSQGDMQVALPGYPAQMAAAYLVVFAVSTGFRAVVGLHLRSSNRIVFYLAGGDVPRERVGGLIEEGNYFVESLGFILASVEIMKLSPPEREALWQQHPLRHGRSLDLEREEEFAGDEVEEFEEVDEVELVEAEEEPEAEIELLEEGEPDSSGASLDETEPDEVLPATEEPEAIEATVDGAAAEEAQGQEPEELRGHGTASTESGPPDSAAAGADSPAEIRRRFLEKLGRLLGSM